MICKNSTYVTIVFEFLLLSAQLLAQVSPTDQKRSPPILPRVTRGTPTIDNNAAEAPYGTQHNQISTSSVLLTIPTLEDDDSDEVRSTTGAQRTETVC